MIILGIDIGGSAVKGAPVDTKAGSLLAERHRVETPVRLTPAQMARQVAAIAGHFKWRGPIGIGFPGVVQDGVILTSANLHPGFIGCDAQRLFARATGCRMTLINDADAAGLAEMRWGAGRKARGTVLLLTLGTGVGSALFYRGVLYPNSELGQLPWKGGRPAEKSVAAAVRKAKGLSWPEWAGRLDAYLHGLETILWPERIILGGGVSAKHEKFLHLLTTRAPVVPAELRNRAGLIGAALYAAEQSGAE
jgi:polyphosphate glucokinase